MADRRKHQRAPARGRVSVRRDGRRRPRTRRSWASILRGLAWLFGPPAVSALMLTLAFPPAEVSWLAYVALAPLLVTAAVARTGKDVFWAALVAGTVFFAINLYWVQPITTAGYVALLPYLGLYWAVWAGLVRWFGRRLRVPLAVVAPVVWVALEWVRGWALTGLPWLFVGHTQYENLALIQTADALGAYGPSALCLATTGLAAAVLVRPILMPRQSGEAASSRDREVAGRGSRPRRSWREERRPGGKIPAILRWRLGRDGGSGAMAARSDGAGRPRPSRALLANLLVVALAWTGTVGYGWYRLAEAPAEGGPVVASVQTNVPQEIKLKARYEQKEQLEAQMLQTQLDLTDEALARAEARGLTADLVVWPETMVPGILNREYLEADVERLIDDRRLRQVFHYLQNRSRNYWLRIRKKAREGRVPILFGAHAVDLQGATWLPGGGYYTRGPRKNTAFLLTPDAEPYRADHRYAKAHLVPFGEYVPFKESWPWLHDALQAFTPYEHDHSLTPGEHDQAPFVLPYGRGAAGGGEAGAGPVARFQVAICYEDALAYRIREMVRATPGDASASRERRRAGGASASRERRRAGNKHRLLTCAGSVAPVERAALFASREREQVPPRCLRAATARSRVGARAPGVRGARNAAPGWETRHLTMAARGAPSRSRLVALRAGESAAGTGRAGRRRTKAVNFIVNISNDGWFDGSWELDQHLNLCVFRAVENRVPVVRSVNTGISAVIQSTGRITAVVARDGERRGVAGCIVGRLVLDDRLSPYTRHGDGFAYGCLLATAGLGVAAVVSRVHGRRGAAAAQE